MRATTIRLPPIGHANPFSVRPTSASSASRKIAFNTDARSVRGPRLYRPRDAGL